MTRFKAVFFDVDGTLYRSREYEENLLESAVAVVAEILKIGRSEAFRRLMTLKREVKTVSRSVEMMGINRSKFYDRLAEVASPEKFIVPSPTVAEMLRNIRRRGV
ncbi:MAG: HAD family hydrolase, partial [Candidatus Caldarchaeum sp.]|nr:HAD family hydrolase [Candidatus Caldarchaeum sp.]